MRFLTARPALFCLLCGLLAGPGVARAASPEVTLSGATVCAVYFRMVVGSMRYGRDLGPLADVEREKMDRAMAIAREKAKEEFGEDMAEEIFQSEWRAILAEMTDDINRNYDNVSKLRYRYDDRCEALVGS